MAKMIGGQRNCGKTTELIRKAHGKQIYILCSDKNRARYIYDLARSLELIILFPITVAETSLMSGRIDNVLVDDIEDVIRLLIGANVVMASTSMELVPLKKEDKTNG